MHLEECLVAHSLDPYLSHPSSFVISSHSFIYSQPLLLALFLGLEHLKVFLPRTKPLVTLRDKHKQASRGAGRLNDIKPDRQKTSTFDFVCFYFPCFVLSLVDMTGN